MAKRKLWERIKCNQQDIHKQENNWIKMGIRKKKRCRFCSSIVNDVTLLLVLKMIMGWNASLIDIETKQDFSLK